MELFVSRAICNYFSIISCKYEFSGQKELDKNSNCLWKVLFCILFQDLALSVGHQPPPPPHSSKIKTHFFVELGGQSKI